MFGRENRLGGSGALREANRGRLVDPHLDASGSESISIHESSFDSFGISSLRNPLHVVFCLMGTCLQWDPQPNGRFELPSEHRLLLVEVVLVVIEPFHISTITAQVGWVMGSSLVSFLQRWRAGIYHREYVVRPALLV